jgi:hypothetical protein
MSIQISFQRLQFVSLFENQPLHQRKQNRHSTRFNIYSYKILSEKEEQLPQLIKNRHKNPTADLKLMVEDRKLSPEIGT